MNNTNKIEPPKTLTEVKPWRDQWEDFDSSWGEELDASGITDDDATEAEWRAAYDASNCKLAGATLVEFVAAIAYELGHREGCDDQLAAVLGG